jgi:DUF4097 and DUF4098 domain-containing protein YvlB
MNRTLTILSIILLSIIAIVLIVFTVILSTRNNDFGFNLFSFMSGQSNKLVESKEFDEVNNININVDAADVYVKYSDNKKYKVELYSDNVESYSVENEEDLNIKLNEKNAIFFIKKQARVVLYIPSDYSNTISISATAGDINSFAFENAKFKISVTSGDVNVDKADVLDITSKTGDVVNSKTNIVLIHSTTGDIKLGEVNKSLDISTTTGDIVINKINLTESSNIKTTTGDIVVGSKNDNIYVEAETTTGDVKVNNNDRFAELVLHIKATTGDVKVG